MGIVIRQSIISTIISYVGVVIGYVSLLYLYPKFMDLEQLGMLRTIQDAAILFSPFAQFGITQSIFRYHPQLAKNQKTSASFISLMLLLSLVGFSLFLIAYKIFEKPALAYFQDNAKAIIQYSYLVIWLTLIMLLTSVLETFSRAVLKTTIPNLLKEVVIRLLLVLLAFLYFKGALTFDQFIIGSVLAYLLCLIILMLYLISVGDLKISFGLAELDQPIMKEMFLYSLLSFAGMAGMILIGKVDSIMVASLIGLAANAVYTNAFYMATVIEMPKRALSQLAMPLIARAFEKNDMKEIDILYKKTAINQFIIGALMLIGIWINLDTVFYFMPKKEAFEAGRWVVLFIGIGKLVDMLFGPSSEIIVLSKHYKFNIILIVCLAGIVIVSNNLLIPAFGITGAAIGAALALIIFNLVKYFFIYAKLGLQPFTVNTLKVLVIAFATLLLNFLLPKLEIPLLDLIFRSSLVTIFFGGAVYFSNASEDGTKIVNLILIKLKLK
jgi:O-antigen/teichoic acid export membrane protein